MPRSVKAGHSQKYSLLLRVGAWHSVQKTSLPHIIFGLDSGNLKGNCIQYATFRVIGLSVFTLRSSISTEPEQNRSPRHCADSSLGSIILPTRSPLVKLRSDHSRMDDLWFFSLICSTLAGVGYRRRLRRQGRWRRVFERKGSRKSRRRRMGRKFPGKWTLVSNHHANNLRFSSLLMYSHWRL